MSDFQINQVPGREPRQAAPERLLDHESTLREVIRLRSDGFTTYEIGQKLGHPDRTVRRWLAEAAQQVREENKDFLREMFAIHQERCEFLYQKLMAKLTAESGFSTDVVKTMLLVLDRQAKLLALDRGRTDKGKNNDWIEKASEQELLAEAKKHNIPVPEKFDVRS